MTVTDSDGATNSTFADVTVIKEADYPPKANAGSNVIISLPQNTVTLYGNSSTDDKGIASYEWNKHEDTLTADMLVSDRVDAGLGWCSGTFLSISVTVLDGHLPCKTTL